MGTHFPFLFCRSLDASSIHAGGGVVSALFVSLFATRKGLAALDGVDEVEIEHWGLLYGGGGRFLGAQALALVVTALWTCALSAAFFERAQASQCAARRLLNRSYWLRQ